MRVYSGTLIIKGRNFHTIVTAPSAETAAKVVRLSEKGFRSRLVEAHDNKVKSLGLSKPGTVFVASETKFPPRYVELEDLEAGTR